MGLAKGSFMQAKVEKNWVEFYQSNLAPGMEPSKFADFIVDFGFDDVKGVVDLGSGNGRDTYRLGQLFDEVFGIDPYVKPNDLEPAHIYFIQNYWENEKDIIRNAHMVYSRFFLHAIETKDIEKILDLTTGYFCAEARSIGDKPVLYPEHKRNFVDGDWLLFQMILRGFKILFYQKSRGLAEYKNEDPLVIRVIAKKM